MRYIVVCAVCSMFVSGVLAAPPIYRNGKPVTGGAFRGWNASKPKQPLTGKFRSYTIKKKPVGEPRADMGSRYGDEARIPKTPTPAAQQSKPAGKPYIKMTVGKQEEEPKQVEAKAPTPQELYLKGEAAMNKGDYKEAVKWFELALEGKPDSEYTKKCLDRCKEKLESKKQ